MKLFAMLALLVGATSVYWLIIRPKLAAQPFFRPLFDRLDAAEAGWWAKIKLWFSVSKTINWGNFQIGAGTLLELLDQLKALDLGIIVPKWAPVILFGMGLVTILLRLVTKESVSDKAQ